MKSRRDIEYATRHLLPKGWVLEELLIAAEDGYVAIVRRGQERARRVRIPDEVLTTWSNEKAVAMIQDAIDAGLGLGRYATTPIIQVGSPWSPYP